MLIEQHAKETENFTASTSTAKRAVVKNYSQEALKIFKTGQFPNLTLERIEANLCTHSLLKPVLDTMNND